MNQVLNQLAEDALEGHEVMKAGQSPPPQSQTDNAQQIRPDRQVTDVVWIIIVGSFAFILIGAFVTLALVVFIAKQVSGDLLLTIFTTTAAFLAGLLVPSPTQAKAPLP